MRDPPPQVCNLDCVVTQHTSTAVGSIPAPSVDLVRISATLTSHLEVSFLISLTLPGLSDPVSALIDSGATSNFLDSSLATLPTFVLEPLDRPITLCLLDGKPATARFIHESVNISVSFADCLTQSLSLLVMKLHPSSLIVLGLPWLQSTNPMIDWSALSLPSKQALNQHCHHWPWTGHALQPPCVTRILYLISLPLLILFLNFVLLQDVRSRPKWSRSRNQHLLSIWGHSRQTLCPL